MKRVLQTVGTATQRARDVSVAGLRAHLHQGRDIDTGGEYGAFCTDDNGARFWVLIYLSYGVSQGNYHLKGKGIALFGSYEGYY